MPLLRRAHARHRDFPPWAKTDVARTATGAGRMTYKPSVKVSKPKLDFVHYEGKQSAYSSRLNKRD